MFVSVYPRLRTPRAETPYQVPRGSPQLNKTDHSRAITSSMLGGEARYGGPQDSRLRGTFEALLSIRTIMPPADLAYDIGVSSIGSCGRVAELHTIGQAAPLHTSISRANMRTPSTCSPRVPGSVLPRSWRGMESLEDPEF